MPSYAIETASLRRASASDTAAAAPVERAVARGLGAMKAGARRPIHGGIRGAPSGGIVRAHHRMDVQFPQLPQAAFFTKRCAAR